jgi:hypothetical protein
MPFISPSTFDLARIGPVWIAYGIPAGLLVLISLALLHPLPWFLVGLVAAIGAAVGMAALERHSPEARASKDQNLRLDLAP